MFTDYHFLRNKIVNIEQAGKIIQLKKGMYVVSPEGSKQLMEFGSPHSIIIANL